MVPPLVVAVGITLAVGSKPVRWVVNLTRSYTPRLITRAYSLQILKPLVVLKPQMVDSAFYL